MMMRVAALFVLLLVLVGIGPVSAEQRVTLGYGRFFSNDSTGDGYDRWQTGSYTISVLSGPRWSGALPNGFGDIIELRFRSSIIAPQNLNGPGSDDRPYATSLTYGVHTHMGLWGGEASAGIDLTMTGPQTGLGEFQEWLHEQISAPTPSDDVLDGQIGDGIHPSLTAGYSYPVSLSNTLTIRPFVEVQAGVEDLARVGGDLIWGKVAQRDLMLRDHLTGHLYRGTYGPQTGFSLIAGADWAQMGDSIYFPASSGVIAEDTRTRARIGVHWQPRPQTSLFYGLTWLSEEFVGQPEGQVLGSLSLKLLF